MKSSNVALERLASLEWADGRTIGIGRTIKIIVDCSQNTSSVVETSPILSAVCSLPKLTKSQTGAPLYTIGVTSQWSHWNCPYLKVHLIQYSWPNRNLAACCLVKHWLFTCIARLIGSCCWLSLPNIRLCTTSKEKLKVQNSEVRFLLNSFCSCTVMNLKSHKTKSFKVKNHF